VAVADEVDVALVSTTFRAGAHGLLLKSTTPVDLVAPVLAAASGHCVLPAVLLPSLVGTAVARRPELLDTLTPEDCQLWRMVADGVETMQIAETLFVSERTAKRMVALLLRRLGGRQPYPGRRPRRPGRPPRSGRVRSLSGDAPKPRASEARAGSIHVSTEKVDELVNLVGELVIHADHPARHHPELSMDRLEGLTTALAQLERNTRDLQQSVLAVRMLPVSFLFGPFHPPGAGLCQSSGKKVELQISGEAERA